MKIAYVSANLGGIDENIQDRHVKQDLPNDCTLDFYYYTEKNFPLRTVALMPRLQAKIPKMLAWDLIPDYDYYIWGDAVITFSNPNAVNWLLEQCLDVDIALFRHQDNRKSIQEELKFMTNHMLGLTNNDFATNYLNSRYGNEPMLKQVEKYLQDKEFVDNKLYSGGLFIYKNKRHVQNMLSDWFLHNCKHTVQDQLSLPYVLNKSACLVNIIDKEIVNNEYTHYYWRNESNFGKWNEFYKNLPQEPSAWFYGDTITYEKGAEFLKDCSTVEDWGCGAGGFKRFRKDAVGIDGSITRFADKIKDLVNYKTTCEGIFIRHVLEHNSEWKTILINALKSATKKLVIIIFTPLNETQSVEIVEGTAENKLHGIIVPNFSLNKNEIKEILIKNSAYFILEPIVTNTQYNIETIYYITK